MSRGRRRELEDNAAVGEEAVGEITNVCFSTGGAPALNAKKRVRVREIATGRRRSGLESDGEAGSSLGDVEW